MVAIIALKLKSFTALRKQLIVVGNESAMCYDFLKFPNCGKLPTSDYLLFIHFNIFLLIDRVSPIRIPLIKLPGFSFKFNYLKKYNSLRSFSDKKYVGVLL